MSNIASNIVYNANPFGNTVVSTTTGLLQGRPTASDICRYILQTCLERCRVDHRVDIYLYTSQRGLCRKPVCTHGGFEALTQEMERKRTSIGQQVSCQRFPRIRARRRMISESYVPSYDGFAVGSTTVSTFVFIHHNTIMWGLLIKSITIVLLLQ